CYSEGNKVDGKLVPSKKVKKVAVESELILFDNEKEGFLHKGSDLPEEAVKDNEVLKEKDDVFEKGKDVEKEMNKEKDVEKVVDQNLDKPEDIEKENCETLKEADFPSIGFEDIESLKGGGRNLFDEKSTV
nr:hypothetical protein [Tanacetum cinerariifolium]